MRRPNRSIELRQSHAGNGRHDGNGRHGASDKRLSSAAPKRSLSPAKMAANRRNASQSTGPRSVEGKKKVSRNAIKHGFCAMSLSPVLPGECEGTFDTVKQEIYNDFHPRTPIEIWLVDHIAMLLWKLMRAAEMQRKLFAMEAEKDRDSSGFDKVRAAPVSPGEALARMFASGESTELMRLERYERSMQSMLLRLISRLQALQKRSNDSLYSKEDIESCKKSEYSETWRRTGWPQETAPLVRDPEQSRGAASRAQSEPPPRAAPAPGEPVAPANLQAENSSAVADSEEAEQTHGAAAETVEKPHSLSENEDLPSERNETASGSNPPNEPVLECGLQAGPELSTTSKSQPVEEARCRFQSRNKSS